MPPKLKDSSSLPTSPEAERSSEAHSSSAEVGSAQPVALEVPVTVNGARAVEGTEKREPFSETTSTVLVLANGAVIRLSSSVAPGQLLFLTNNKSRKEVVCQVVKSKSYRSASGYVELEFTEPVLGFWGMRFPGDRTASSSLAAAPKTDPAAAEPVKSAEPKTSSYADARQPAEPVTANLADVVKEFETEIKTDARASSKADFLTPAEPSSDGLKPEANRLQEQLSALLFAEQKEAEAKPSVPVAPPSKQQLADTAAKLLEIANEEPPAAKLETTDAKGEVNPAPTAPRETPVAAKPSFDNEEVKIPAWLEPLARNANVRAPREEESAGDSSDQLDDWQAPEPSNSASSQKATAATTAKKPASTATHKPTAAVFGNSLLGEASLELSKPRGSNKKVWLAIAAGLILAAASGAWYFRDALGLAGPSNNTSGTNALAATVAPTSQPAAPVSPADVAPALTKSSSASAADEPPAPVSSLATQGKVQTTAITERISKANPANDSAGIEVVEPEIKRPSLGKVRLAKPKASHSASAHANVELEPTLELSGDVVSGAESSLGGSFAESQPAAPVQVGGDVRPARMISSVPPVYPMLAKAQHVAGDVRVDALIDAHGRVTTMKVVAGPSLLHQAAMDSLRQWKYQPATLDGKPVAMHLTVTIQFRLQ